VNLINELFFKHTIKHQQFIINRIEVSADKRYLGAATSSQALIYDLPSQKTEPVFH
jgi:hypothetical protein